MSKRIILSLVLLIMSVPIFSQVEIKSPDISLTKANGDLIVLAGTVDFKFSNIGTWWIPKFRPFGTSTVFADSTNYVTLNKGFYVRDSIKTDLDLIVKGAVVLDTNRLGKIQYRGNGIYLSNDKVGGNMTFQLMDDAPGSAGDFTWLFGNYLTGQTGMTLDSTTGLTVNQGNIQLGGTTQQIKLPSDTASDYDGNDNITLNRQSGKLFTKSLTTGAGGAYDLTLTNSLITANSIIYPIVYYNGGTNTRLAEAIHIASVTSGSCIITIINREGANAFNGTIKIGFIIFN